MPFWPELLSNRTLQLDQETFIKSTNPAKSSQLTGTVLYLTRSKAELLAENALLRQQLIDVTATCRY